MLDSHDEVVASIDAAPAPPSSTAPEIAAPEIKVEPADAIRRFALPKDDEKGSTRKGSSVGGRLLRLVTRVGAAACLCGVGWAAGAYYSGAHSPLAFLHWRWASPAQQSAKQDDVARAMAQMAQQIRALKASVDGKAPVAQDAGAEGPTRAAIAELASRVGKLEADTTTKLSRINEQLAGIEQKIEAPHAISASRRQRPHRHVEHLHDAFNPAKDPTAPGAPRPLGAW